MKNLSALVGVILLSCSTGVFAQNVLPFVDFNNRFRTFENGFFRYIEMRDINGFKAGDDVLAYVDVRSNLRVFDGKEAVDVSNVVAEYEVSDHLMVWKIGTTLNLWDDGDLHTLSHFVGQYVLRDSLVVYQDLRFNEVKVYYQGKNYVLYQSTGNLTMPDFVGENLVAYRDNGNLNTVFWSGQTYELGVWHNPIRFKGGTDILAFNDPMNGTFAIFDCGEFLDVENFHMNAYDAGRGFIVYENLNGELIYYGNGKWETLTHFAASYWEVKDDVVVWGENNMFYAYVNETKTEVARYTPKDYGLKNGVVVFRNPMGGVDAFVNGTHKTLTNQDDASYSIHGNSVLVELFNKSFLVYQNGKIYRN